VALAGRAGDLAAHAHRRGAAREHEREGELERDLHVAARGARALPKERGEELIEHVMPKDVLQVALAHPPALKGVARRFAAPIAVIALAALGLREDGVGLVDELKAVLGPRL